MRISDWSSDVCSSDLPADGGPRLLRELRRRPFWALFLVFFLTAIAVFSVSLQSVAYLVEQGFSPLQAAGAFGFKIGRASCRARVCQYVSISVVAVSIRKKRQ